MVISYSSTLLNISWHPSVTYQSLPPSLPPFSFSSFPPTQIHGFFFLFMCCNPVLSSFFLILTQIWPLGAPSSQHLCPSDTTRQSLSTSLLSNMSVPSQPCASRAPALDLAFSPRNPGTQKSRCENSVCSLLVKYHYFWAVWLHRARIFQVS